MKKIDFGYNNSLDNGSFEGLGLSEKAVGPVGGDLLGVVSLGNEDFLVSEVTEAFGNDENYIGRIIARNACVDLFPDASGILFIDQQESVVSKKLEELLNNDNAKEKIKNGSSIYDVCNGNVSPFAYEYECAIHSSTDYPVSVVALKHNLFKNMKFMMDKRHTSILDMQKDMEEYDQYLNNGHSR